MSSHPTFHTELITAFKKGDPQEREEAARFADDIASAPAFDVQASMNYYATEIANREDFNNQLGIIVPPCKKLWIEAEHPQRFTVNDTTIDWPLHGFLRAGAFIDTRPPRHADENINLRYALFFQMSPQVMPSSRHGFPYPHMLGDLLLRDDGTISSEGGVKYRPRRYQPAAIQELLLWSHQIFIDVVLLALATMNGVGQRYVIPTTVTEGDPAMSINSLSLESMNVDVWYRAAAFPTHAASRAVWEELRNLVARGEFPAMPIMTVMVGGVYHVIAASDHEIPPAQRVILNRVLAKGTICEVPVSVIETIMKRHYERLLKLNPGESQDYESHEPTFMHNDDKLQTRDEADTQRAEVVRHLTARGYTFSEIYALQCGYLDILGAGPMHQTQSFPDLVRDVIKRSDRYLFTQSAQNMHEAVFTGETDFIAPAQPLWLEFNPPMVSEQWHVLFKAIHVFPIDATTWMINVIDAVTTIHVMSLVYSNAEQRYSPTVLYPCLFDECQDEKVWVEAAQQHMVQRIPCEHCIAMGSDIAAYLHTAMELIQRKYATEPDPAPWPVEITKFEETQTRRVPREKNPKKLKTEVEIIIHETPYIVVSYEVSEKQRARLDDFTNDAELSAQPRGNWLTMHGSGDIIYQKIEIESFERHHRTRKDGTRESEDTYFVEGHTRYQPMLRADVRKTAIKKVVARKYEDKA